MPAHPHYLLVAYLCDASQVTMLCFQRGKHRMDGLFTKEPWSFANIRTVLIDCMDTYSSLRLSFSLGPFQTFLLWMLSESASDIAAPIQCVSRQAADASAPRHQRRSGRPVHGERRPPSPSTRHRCHCHRSSCCFCLRLSLLIAKGIAKGKL